MLNLKNPADHFKQALLNLMRDESLLPVSKNLWITLAMFESNFKGKTLSDISAYLGIKERHLREIQKELCLAGWLEKRKIGFGAALQYTVCYPFKQTDDMQDFMDQSQFFSKLTIAGDLAPIIRKYKNDAHAVYRTMSRLEQQYMQPGTKKQIKNPLGLLISQMSSGNIPSVDFNANWWNEDKKAAKREALEKKKRKEQETKERDDERAADEKVNTWWNNLTEVERKVWHSRALDKMRNNGGVPQFGLDLSIKYEAFDLALSEKTTRGRKL